MTNKAVESSALFAKVLSSLLDDMPSRFAVLRIADASAGSLEARASMASIESPLVDPPPILFSAHAAGRAARERATARSESPAEVADIYPGCRAILAAPIVVGERVLGTVELIDRIANSDDASAAAKAGIFSDEDEKRMPMLISDIAPAFRRVGLFSEMEDVILNYRRRNQEQTVLGMVSRRILATESVDEILYITLTAITSGHGMGYNRALALLADPGNAELRGASGIGATKAEVGRVWKEVPERIRRLEDHLDTTSLPAPPRSLFDARVREITVPLDPQDSILARVIKSRRASNIRDASSLASPDKWLAEFLESKAFAAIPIWGRTEVIGVIVIDNFFTAKPIFDSDLVFLESLANQCGLALDGAMLVEELSRAMKQLEDTTTKLIAAERLAAIGEIAASIAHEIRNPLTAIGGFSRRLARRLPDDATGQRYMDIIEKEITRLELLASEVLDFAVVGKEELKQIDLLNLVRQWRDTNEFLVASKKLHFKIEAPVVMAYADQLLIGQAVTNILLNAVQAAPQGGEVSCFGGVRQNHVFLEIRDNGRGMSPVVIESAFKPFFTTKQAGTGLGLALAQKAVVAHGGEIEIESEPGHGATVRIVLPAR